MTCDTCADLGLVALNWADAPDDYALCLCRVGQSMRATVNTGKRVPALWEVWCAREQVDPSRIYRLEDVLTDDELRDCGFAKPETVSREAALLAAGNRKR